MNLFENLIRGFFGGDIQQESREIERVEIIEDVSDPREEDTVREVEDWTNGRPYPLENPSYTPVTDIISRR